MSVLVQNVLQYLVQLGVVVQGHLVVLRQVGGLPAEGADHLTDVLVGDDDCEVVGGTVLAALVLTERHLDHRLEGDLLSTELALLDQQSHGLVVLPGLLDDQPHLLLRPLLLQQLDHQLALSEGLDLPLRQVSPDLSLTIAGQVISRFQSLIYLKPQLFWICWSRHV